MLIAFSILLVQSKLPSLWSRVSNITYQPAHGHGQHSYMFEVALCDGGVEGGTSSHASVQICHELLVQGEDVFDV